MSGQVNYSTAFQNGRFFLSLNVHLTKSDQTFQYKGLNIARVVGGNGEWQIGHELCRIGKGDILFLSNLDPRRVTAASDALFLETFGFNIATLSSAGAGDCLRVFYGRKNGFTHVVRMPELYPLMDAAREEFLSGKPVYSLLLAYAIQILVGAGRYYDRVHPGTLEENFRCDSTSVGAVAASAAYVNEHLTEDLRVEELARIASMSEGHFTRIFRRYVGITPVDYIARCRVNRFLSLMRVKKSNVLETAFACGFTSASGFYKAFHHVCGCSPKEERSVSGDLSE